MNYHSAEFIFFLIFTIFAFYIVKDSYKKYILIRASLVWYSSWGLESLLTLLLIVLFNYFALSLCRRKSKAQIKYFRPVLVAINILVFIYLKTVHYWTSDIFQPVGLSFFMLMIIGLVIEYPTTENELTFSFSDFLFLPLFFPLLVSGPVEKGSKIFPQIQKLSFNFSSIVDGILIISFGFSRRLLIALPLKKVILQIFEKSNLSWTELLLFSFISTFQFYFDFASCCDIGRGAAKCFGINLSVNFRPFYYAKNPIDFWQRWNISISTWIRDYISFPLMLTFGKKMSPIIFIFISALLMGLWHGLHLNWLYFGVFNGLIMVFYSLSKNKLQSYPKVFFVFGLALVILMYGINGLLQQNTFLEILQNLFIADSHSNQSLKYDLFFSNQYLVLWIVFSFIIEFFQERFNQIDFYLMAPQKFKFIFAFLLSLSFLILLHYNLILEYKSEIPLYFKI